MRRKCYQVNFEKQFTAGMLKGKYYSCNYLRFDSWQAATDFANTCDGKTEVNPCDGTDWRYINSCPIVTALEV